MRKPTPVTTRVMIDDSGSSWNERSALKEPDWTQAKRVLTSGKLSAETLRSPKNETRDRRKEAKTDRQACQETYRLGSRLPATARIKALAPGKSGMSQKISMRYPFIRFKSSALIDFLCRKTRRMMARPTAASAAATVMIKKTMTWPAGEPAALARAIKARFAAFSMTSTAMNIVIRSRLTKNPMIPRTKSTRL